MSSLIYGNKSHRCNGVQLYAVIDDNKIKDVVANYRNYNNSVIINQTLDEFIENDLLEYSVSYFNTKKNKIKTVNIGKLLYKKLQKENLIPTNEF